MTDEAVVRIRPMTTVWRWSARLARSIALKDGTRLVTLGDLRMFILKQPEQIQGRSSWHQAVALVILAAERGGSIDAATVQGGRRAVSGRAVRASVAMMCAGAGPPSMAPPPVAPIHLGAGNSQRA
jgi:hypothetical protein